MAEAYGPPLTGRGESWEFARYLLAGVANTAVGYLVFLGLVWWSRFDPRLANACSYAVGLLLSLLLNRFFVFRGATVTAAAVTRFFAGFAVAYALNLLVLWLLLTTAMPVAVAQLLAMAVYTASFYAINRAWVWRDRACGAVGQAR